MPTLEKIMWFILYHFAFAAAIITISKGGGAAIAANVFWWFDLLVYFVEAAIMARILDHVEIKGLTDQGAPKSNVDVTKK
ncbi:unnamed protein product [Oikopleura dioica]|uniref:Uncharacterized protein n=1 Tax=Oikopleura dioica TaxID=34765 RepID=E4X1T9_OIKDI|nr:unnamed protein product [Oikopleura dioica]